MFKVAESGEQLRGPSRTTHWREINQQSFNPKYFEIFGSVLKNERLSKLDL